MHAQSRKPQTAPATRRSKAPALAYGCLLILVTAHGCGDSNGGSDSGDLQAILGVWEGAASQGDFTWTIRATIGVEEQTVEYPSLGCGGTWTLLEAGGGDYLFSEDITFGESACIDDGLVELVTISNDELEYLFYVDEESRQAGVVEATGTLERGGSGGTGGTGGAGAAGGAGGMGGTGGVEPPTTITDNNYARLNGDAVGGGTQPTSGLRKTVEITVVTPNPDVEVATAGYVFRRANDVETTRWHFVLTNRSTTVACFIRLSDIMLKDVDGNVLADAGISFVNGNIGDPGNGMWTGTCLEPGASGPVLDIDSAEVYSEITSIEIGSISTATTMSAPPPAIVRGTRYARQGSGDAFSVTVENIGAGPAFIGGSSRYVLLDDANEPLWWSFLDGEGEIAPGEEFELAEDNSLYEGEANTMDVYVDFEEGP
ncbi:MAG: hypothetical protein AAF500_14225 [Myxococcota bacterium]